MNTKFARAVGLCCTLGLAACASQPTQEQTGMVVGGVLGGALGSQIGGGSGAMVGAVVGTLIGATVGGSVGRSMDDRDRINVTHALESSQTGVPSSWHNPDTGNQYTFEPTRTYDSGGQPCREYSIKGTVGGKGEKVYGTACRQSDGSWRTVG